MNFSQLEQLWIQNGGNPLMAPVAAAVAYAESTGNPNAVGDGGTSLGLWQIHYTVHPQFNASQLFDPNYNAQAAIQLSGNGANWTPWTTWNNYQKGSGYGASIISSLLGGKTPPATTSSSSSSSDCSFQNVGLNVGKFLQCLNPAQVSNWAPMLDPSNEVGAIASSAIVFVGAIALVGIGGLWLIFGTNTGEQVVKTSGKVAAMAA